MQTDHKFQCLRAQKEDTKMAKNKKNSKKTTKAKAPATPRTAKAPATPRKAKAPAAPRKTKAQTASFTQADVDAARTAGAVAERDSTSAFLANANNSTAYAALTQLREHWSTPA